MPSSAYERDKAQGHRIADRGRIPARKNHPLSDFDPGLDFPGMGLHSFRPANVSWRQGVGKASAIEASKIAGHATVSMTGEYTKVQLKQQDELNRAIQGWV